MRALVFTAPDGRPESTALQEVLVPDPLPGQALVKVAHAGLNYADLMMRSGIYPHPKGYPLVAGLELSGTVVAVGQGVTTVAPGDRVAAFSEDAGAFAEYCAVPVERIIPLPDSMGFDTAAAFYVQAMTAWHLLHTVSTTRPGDTVLIHAIGGGVGLFLTQMAKQAGAVVIGTVGTAGKEVRPLAFGADVVINRAEQDFVAVCLEMTNGRGVDKVVDSTGASILDASFDAVRKLGHVVSYGEAEGKPFANLWERLVQKSLTFTRMHLGHMDFASPAWKAGTQAVLAGIEGGEIRVPIERTYTLETAEQMFAALASRRVAGKIILKIGG